MIGLNPAADLIAAKKNTSSMPVTSSARRRRPTSNFAPVTLGQPEPPAHGKRPQKWTTIRSALKTNTIGKKRLDKLRRIKAILNSPCLDRTEQELDELYEWILVNSQQVCPYKVCRFVVIRPFTPWPTECSTFVWSSTRLHLS